MPGVARAGCCCLLPTYSAATSKTVSDFGEMLSVSVVTATRSPKCSWLFVLLQRREVCVIQKPQKAVNKLAQHGVLRCGRVCYVCVESIGQIITRIC